MNTTNNIAAMQSQGVTNAPQNQPKGLDSQGLFGVLNGVLQQAQATPESNGPSPAAQGNIKALTEKIAALLQKQDNLPPELKDMTPDQIAAVVAALLQKNGVLPAALQNMTPDEIAAKIAALIQQNGTASGIQPTLTSDLIAPMALEIQDTAAAKPTNEELAALLNKLSAAGDDAGEIAKILSQLQAQNALDAAGADILQQLKDKIAELQLSNGEINKDVLVDFKADIMAFLKDQGMDSATIEHYMSALAKFLRLDDATPAAEVATAAAAQTTPVHDVSAKAVPHTAQAADVLADLKPKSIVLPDAAVLMQAAGRKDDGAQSLRQELPATTAPQAQQQASTTPQQSLTAKISGIGVNPAMINALANGGGNSGADGFGQQGTAQQDMANGAGMLKPVSVENLNNQNFTNYLTAARNLPSPVTQMVNIQLQRGINSKIDSLTLQLEPADLGRLDIKLKFNRDGSIRAHMTVDKPETLALLQKDSHHLERALQQAGIDADENSLSFDLRQQSQQHNLEGFDGRNRNTGDFSTHINGGAAEKAIQAKIAIQSHGYITSSGVNIMV